MTLSADLIAEAKRGVLDTAERTTSLLDIAARIAALEGNLIYLTSCMAATAEDACERKTTPAYQIARHWDLMEIAARALAGFPVWRHPSTATASVVRCEAARAAIGKRMKKVS